MDTGTRLKLVRESYKLSQRELARRSGVTNATISLIEQNRVSPSVSSLKKLLEGIPMSLADFFTFDQPPREHQYVFRANEQPDLGRDGLRLLMIGAPVANRQMRFLREQYAPGASSGEEAIVHAEGEECGLVTPRHRGVDRGRASQRAQPGGWLLLPHHLAPQLSQHWPG